MKIQVDMFEVGLGAALLLQFETKGGVVRVLADGGVTGYPTDWVLKKLPNAVKDFGAGDSLHIDLIVGTHYDGDHLVGLVPIILDERVTIGEAWLPPVANDVQSHALDSRPRDSEFLALQLARPGAKKVLAEYLRYKADVCEQLESVERAGEDDHPKRAMLKSDEVRNGQEGLLRKAVFTENGSVRRGPALNYFKAHLEDCQQQTGSGFAGGCHADEDAADPDGFLDPREPDEFWFDGDFPRAGLIASHMKSLKRENPTLATAKATSLAMIRKNEAKDAITAIHLAGVVEALQKRRVNIRAATIDDGQPRRFVWKKATKRFVPTAQESTDGPELTLLGPSIGLVGKHRDRLPTGSYMAKAAMALIPIEGITPSNQLSYVMRFAHSGQNILVTGDAGFVDFKPSGRQAAYHQHLIDCIKGLNVVQIAHHAGHNAHFYRCLLAAGFADEKEQPLLLLSHGVNDKHRPSSIFGKFIEQVRKGGRPNLLFTSQPLEAKVRDYLQLIYPVTGGDPADRGDIQLIFDGKVWVVKRHLVRV